MGVTRRASKTGGLNIRNDNDLERQARLKSLSGYCGADPPGGGGEGRCRRGRNGYEHLASHRGTGPGIRGRTRRDNVGKGHLPAGAGSNLQRPAARGHAEGGGRVMVWRMSPYERRRRGNALRGGARHHPGRGNTRAGQRGSGHLAAAGQSSDFEPGIAVSSKQRRAWEQTTIGRGVYEPAF